MALKPETISLTQRAVAAAEEKLARDIVALDLSNQGILADVFLIVTGANDPQLEAISTEIQMQLQKVGRNRSTAKVLVALLNGFFWIMAI